MAKDPVAWIAGAAEYQGRWMLSPDPAKIHELQWLFIGLTVSGELRRWALCYCVPERKFTLRQIKVSQWDSARTEELANFYRPVAVTREQLPRRTLLSAMRALLSDKDIAQATALSIGAG